MAPGQHIDQETAVPQEQIPGLLVEEVARRRRERICKTGQEIVVGDVPVVEDRFVRSLTPRVDLYRAIGLATDRTDAHADAIIEPSLRTPQQEIGSKELRSLTQVDGAAIGRDIPAHATDPSVARINASREPGAGFDDRRCGFDSRVFGRGEGL